VLCVFSGRQNPVWRLSDSQILDFLKILGTIADLTVLQKTESRLGYSGWSLTSQDGQVWEIGHLKCLVLEEFLLSTAPNSFSQSLKASIQNEIDKAKGG